jgi:NADPH2:quinone reductase
VKAIGLTEFGGPDVLHIVDLTIPEHGPDEIRIRVHAVAVNPTDATFRAGGRASQLADRTPPYVPGVDVAGVIDELAERIVVDEESVVHAPKDTTDGEASTLLLNALTAHLSLDAVHLDAGRTLAVTHAAPRVFPPSW